MIVHAGPVLAHSQAQHAGHLAGADAGRIAVELRRDAGYLVHRVEQLFGRQPTHKRVREIAIVLIICIVRPAGQLIHAASS